ncbi:MAG TPA: TylF/MycF/NovP-related O-methyltransferase [Ferrovibrio sp.]|uniref:TylF/MycF/NovP-related O-methyltransferase n=1 Tax=Ferrovibrio sp. TaxID=1917215 RepID=UPI002ED18848
MSETAKQPMHSMDALIRHAAESATDSLAFDVAARVAELAGRFEAACADLPAAPLALVIFHLKLPEEHRRIDYVDIKADQGNIDYVSVLRHTFAMARGFNPDARIIYITGEGDDTSFVPADIVTVRLPLKPQWLMYERVVAMAAYMQSAAFAQNTVFLDSDAFCNWPLGKVFQLSFDVAVTFRDQPGLMPVNEGVIFAAHRPNGAARHFFTRYLATYEALCRSKTVADIYGDIRRWRGGQLALNGASAAVGTLSEIDQRMLSGALVRYLPCDDYNFFIRDNETYQLDVLQRKYILHLKGPAKGSVPAVSRFQQQRLQQWLGPNGPQPGSAAGAAFVKPVFALINKEYNKPPFGTKESQQRFGGLMQSAMQMLGANQPGSGAAAVDDMVVWFRNLGFLQQPDFIAAFEPYLGDNTLRARIWRIYMLCWAAKSCLGLAGDFMDVGCYDGKTVDVMERYCNFRATAGKTWWLYDMFENPPDEARKVSHGPQLFDRVRGMFEPFGNFRVIKGAVPDSFAQGLPGKVAFAQLDLNVAAPELAALEIIYERMVPGGMIVFDDFGFRRYRDSHDAEMGFFRARGDVVWESPTGQGLFIKR